MLSKLSVKKPYTVIVGIILAIVLGYISFTHMSTDLLPSMNLPYVVVYTPYPGATPEQVETDITRPMESAFATLTDIKKITSQSRDNTGVVIMQFNDGANMDTALIEISSRLDQLKGGWDDDIGAPVALKLNPDMLPVAILSVSRDDMDILELSDYVTDELVPSFEALNGVASATANGVIEQEIDVTIDQHRIDVVNSIILADVDAELADVERQLDSAQAQISSGKRQLGHAREEAEAQLAEAEAQLLDGEGQIAPAIEQMTTQRQALTEQRETLASGVQAMESVMKMSDAEKAGVQEAAKQLTALREQKQALEQQLTQLQDAGGREALIQSRADAQAERDALVAQRDALKAYMEDAQLSKPELLNGDIARLNAAIAEAEAGLTAQNEELNALNARRDALKARVASLGGRMLVQASELPSASPSTTPGIPPIASPEVSPSASPEVGPSATPGAETSATPEATPGTTPGISPSATPEAETSAQPTDTPAIIGTTAQPTDAPAIIGTTAQPTDAPAIIGITAQPTDAPAIIGTTAQPTDAPAIIGTTAQPTEMPVIIGTTAQPTDAPAIIGTTAQPTETPVIIGTTAQPTDAPAIIGTTAQPTDAPAIIGTTAQPTEMPVIIGTTAQPTDAPAIIGTTAQPTDAPSVPGATAQTADDAAALADGADRSASDAPAQSADSAPAIVEAPAEPAEVPATAKPTPTPTPKPANAHAGESSTEAEEVTNAEAENVAQSDFQSEVTAVEAEEAAASESASDPSGGNDAPAEAPSNDDAAVTESAAADFSDFVYPERVDPAPAFTYPDASGAAANDGNADFVVEESPSDEAAAMSDADEASPEDAGETAPQKKKKKRKRRAGSSDGEVSGGGDDYAAFAGWLSAHAESNEGASEADVAAPETEAELAEARAELEALEQEIAAKGQEIGRTQNALATLKQQLDAKEKALETQGDSATAAEKLGKAQQDLAEMETRLAALDQQIADIDAQLTAGGGDVAVLTQQIDALDRQIKVIEATGAEDAAAMLADPARLNAQYIQAQSGLSEMDAGIAQLDTYIDKLNSGVIPGGLIPGMDEDTDLASARAELNAAREQMEAGFAQASSMLAKAQKELNKARREFIEKRDEALEDAGIDGVITVQMVAQILGAQNLSMPAGYAHDARDDKVLVRVGEKFGSINELKRMKLFDLDLEHIPEVRLMDVATVEVADNRDEVFTKLNDADGILLSLEKQSTFSTADVAKAVLAHAKALQAEHPELHIVDLMNQGEYIDIVVDSVLNNLLSGGALAILILLLFLLDWRPTLTVAFSIPVSVVVAFVCMYFTGINLNVLSLSGLSLGIGMLVDNSIVSIENIYRLHDEEGVPLLHACVKGVQSVAGALFSSTLTTICVFLPIVFVQGMARDLFSDMGLTIAYSLLASLVVAMTVVPMMCSFLMRRSKPKKHRIFSKLQAAYGALLRGALRVKPLVLLVAIALLAFAAMQVSQMGISFMPEVNSRQMTAELTPDKDLSSAEQKAQAARILSDMLQIEGIQSIGVTSGSSSLLTASDGFSYYIIVDEDAHVKNVDIARRIEALGRRYDADLTAQASTMDISMMTGDGISAEITGDDIETLQAIAGDVAELARQTEGATDVSDGLEDAVPELRIIVNKELAINEGLTEGQVYQFIAQKLLEKTEVAKVTLNGKEMKVQLIEGRNQGLRPDDLRDLEIEIEREDAANSVRVGDISRIRDSSSLSTIQRASQRRMVAVSFHVAEGYSANHVSDAFAEKLKGYDLPDGYKIELTGENETVMDILNDLVWMILVAILLIFLIMVAQFQSFKSPIIVMFTIPLAFTGGLLALLLTRMDLSIVSMLGFLVLSGVVVNNGIVFIDCVNQLRIGGMEKRAALVEAGRQRLRPILMTALTTILGMSTMALGHGTGAEMMQPMAVVSIGGLSYATLMTLFVVPVLYDLFNGREMKAREIQMIREAAGMNGDSLLEDGDTAEASNRAGDAHDAPAQEVDPGATAPSPAPADDLSGDDATAGIEADAPTRPTAPGKRILRVRLTR